MKPSTDTDTHKSFEKFKQLTQKIISVPKSEVDKKQAEYERKKKQKRTQKS